MEILKKKFGKKIRRKLFNALWGKNSPILRNISGNFEPHFSRF